MSGHASHGYSETTHDTSGHRISPAYDDEDKANEPNSTESDGTEGDESTANGEKRKAMRRCYTPQPRLIEVRQGKRVLHTFNWSDAEDSVLAVMEAEAVASALMRGATDEEILSGEAFPDRNPPELREHKTRTRTARVPRDPNVPHHRSSRTIRAIATVWSRQWAMTKPEFDGDIDAAYRAAEIFVSGLTQEQRLKLRKVPEVHIELLKTMPEQSLDDILAGRTADDEDDEDEAAEKAQQAAE